MATKQNLIPILVRITYWQTNSIISNNHDKFINSITYKVTDIGNYKDGKFHYIDSLDFLEAKKNKTYFCNNKPIWTIDFIDEISNNQKVDCYENLDTIENLIESISDYSGDCGVSKIIKDVERFFDKDYANRKGKETRKFITLFTEWSYYDSYVGDGDYGIEYRKLAESKELFEEVGQNNFHDFY